MTQSPAPPALPAKNIHISQLSLQNNNLMSAPASSNFNSHHNMLSAANSNVPLNGNLGLDRKFSTTSQPPMHLNYPPKPHQSLQTLQTSTPHLTNGSLRRTSMQHMELPMSIGQSNVNRGTSVGYPNNPTSGPSNNFMNNRGLGQPPSAVFQQGILGPNNNVNKQPQHSLHPQLQNGHGQFHGQQAETPLIQHVSKNRICM